jgi:SAM-dependent methyltransferase
MSVSSRAPGRLVGLLDALHVPRRVDPQAPLARALADHARSGRPRTLRALRPSGLEYEIETGDFFELAGDQSPIDAGIVEHARGRVLDVGAGAGRHALALQARGLSVCAIDVSPICVELLRARGVEDAHEADVWDCVATSGDAAGAPGARPEAPAWLRDARFDTVLFGMQSIGIVGSLAGLDEMLKGLQPLLAPAGQVLLDSSAPVDADFEALFTFEADGSIDEAETPGAPIGLAGVPPDRLAGEALVSFSYLNWRGRFFPWLYLGSSALSHAAGRQGMRCDVLARADESPEYLARLEPAGRSRGDVYDPDIVPSAAEPRLVGSLREGRS